MPKTKKVSGSKAKGAKPDSKASKGKSKDAKKRGSKVIPRADASTYRIDKGFNFKIKCILEKREETATVKERYGVGQDSLREGGAGTIET